jgi:hypothetical protein
VGKKTSVFNANTLGMMSGSFFLTKVRATGIREAKIGLNKQKALPEAHLTQED